MPVASTAPASMQVIQRARARSIAGLQFLQRGRGIGGQVAIALGDEEVDHVVEAESLPVGG